MHNIILLGPQGSGKGTQAKFLAQKFNLEHIEPGRRLRRLAEENSELGKKVDYYINQKGVLVPTSLLINQVLKRWIDSLPPHKGVVCDGTPRRLREAKLLEKMLKKTGRIIDYVFFIKISEEETFRRLAKRLTCKKCTKQFIWGKDIKDEKRRCSLCGGKLYKRRDDNKEAIHNRLLTFHKETMPVIRWYKKRDKLIEINGEQSIDKVHQDIMSHIRNE